MNTEAVAPWEYTNAVATLQSNLDTAYDGIKKQNAVVEQLVAQRVAACVIDAFEVVQIQHHQRAVA